MRGEGTIESPWEVESVNDFISLSAYNLNLEPGETGYAKLMKTIDFNEHEEYKNGIEDSIVMADKIIFDGDGNFIFNIFYKSFKANTVVCDFKEIHNTKFANFVFAANTSSDTSGGFFSPTCLIQKCSFGFFFQNGKFNIIRKTGSSGTCEKFIDCSFAFKGSHFINTSFDVSRLAFQRCHFHYVDFIVNKINSRCMGTGANATFDNVYETGNIIANWTDETNTAFTPLISKAKYSSSFNAVTVTNLPEIVTELGWSNYAYPPTFDSVCFIDKDLISNANPNISTYTTKEAKFKNLETWQCKSSTELQKIGFPVAQAGE